MRREYLGTLPRGEGILEVLGCGYVRGGGN